MSNREAMSIHAIPSVSDPKELVLAVAGHAIPADALGQAIDQFLHAKKQVDLPRTDEAAIAITLPRETTPNALPEEIDPFHPGEQVWQALEQEAEEETRDKLHKAQEYHPEPPVELPDISNL